MAYLHTRRRGIRSKGRQALVVGTGIVFIATSSHQIAIGRRNGIANRYIEYQVLTLIALALVYDHGLRGIIKSITIGIRRTEIWHKHAFGRHGRYRNALTAGAIAGALKADRLLLLTDVPGVKGSDGEVMTALNATQVRAMITDGIIAGGMIPKTETALKALDAGVRAAVILDGRLPNASLLELFTDHGAGSMIRSA